MLAFLLVAHLVGDLLLQNHWMQRKSQSSWVCSVHVACYAIPFVVLALVRDLPWMLVIGILLQHWLQDRFQLHGWWMLFYRQSPPDKWPIGMFCVDQAWHVAWIAGLCLAFGVC